MFPDTGQESCWERYIQNKKEQICRNRTMEISMKMIQKKISLIITGLTMSILLVGCAARFDAAGYVKGILNNIYLDNSAEYRESVEISMEDAHEEYLRGLEAEADFLIQYYGIDGGVSEDVHQEIVSLYQEIYKASRFEVSDAVAVGADYRVDVIVSPMDIFINSEKDILTEVETFFSSADPEKYEKQQKLNDEVAMIVVDTIRGNLSELGYQEPVTITVMVEINENGYYSIDNDALNQIGQLMIAY